MKNRCNIFPIKKMIIKETFKNITNFHLADLIVRFTVAYKARMSFVKILKNKLSIKFLYLLYKIGLIKSFNILNDNIILVYLKYKKNGTPLIHSIDLISKPSKR